MLATMPPPLTCTPPYEYISANIFVFQVGIKANPRPPKARVLFFSQSHLFRVSLSGNINLTGIKGCVNVTYNLHPVGISVAFDDPPIWSWTDSTKPLNSISSGDFGNISPIENQSFNVWYKNPTPNQVTDRYYSIMLVDGGKKCQNQVPSTHNNCEIDPIYHNGDGNQSPGHNIFEEIYDVAQFIVAYVINVVISLV